MPANSKIEQLRKDYSAHTLEMEEVSPNPVEQFQVWFEEALNAEVPEPNAMTLSTATTNGVPSARIVLLKGVTDGSFLFYTNYNSRKGQELLANPRAALTFLWHELQRQVRIEGRVEVLPAEASTRYFQSRPKGSQIGAWASPQSTQIESREVLEEKVKQLEEDYRSADVLPRPEHWGGYRVIPHRIEFWQGRSSRLHDRIEYTLSEDGNWSLARLAP
ncbi:pyridoxamine 5'-phosphate oxidase [Phaeodactylibacter sp.]|uniref:pyridoxamine 5'-phosphate oxidase n=1 Tax=Phaeodactylibacter sp. TaxID=1940289 RepID=UPI000591F01F|nr:pyridoxamine 5'-phosphate oxidase [Phaeodactylibacter sp.]MCI4647065.1 pyridoxamine 5'-phosphate oxidase [Phaeodactylibacter sp.]MCI5090041.1 pyridoxamine 5'-phosphate oxidase [Phaeodactylibacter sp.]